jgi:hypothetical protein
MVTKMKKLIYASIFLLFTGCVAIPTQPYYGQIDPPPPVAAYAYPGYNVYPIIPPIVPFCCYGEGYGYLGYHYGYFPNHGGGHAGHR